MAILPGLGTKIAYQTGGSYVNVAQVISIGGFSLEYGTAGTSNLDSVAETIRGTMLKSGVVPFQIQYDPDAATHTFIQNIMLGGISQPAINWKLILTDTSPTSWTFSGVLTKFDISGFEAEGNVIADIEITRSGAPTVA